MADKTFIIIAPGGSEVSRVTVDAATTAADVRFFDDVPEDHAIVEA